MLNDKRRASLLAKADRLSLDELRATVAKILAKQKSGRKKHEKRQADTWFKDIFTDLPVKRVYKDQVTFVFGSEDEFIAALKAILQRYESENREE